MLFSTTTHTTGKPPKHHHPHHHNNNKKNQRSKRESKKSKSHRNLDQFVGRSKSHKKSKSHRERLFVGSWREGFGSLAKSKAHGSKIGSWVRRSAKSKA